MTPWRTAPLPPNWAHLRRLVLERDQMQCQVAGPHCTRIATEVDHTAGAGDHSLTNLQAVCASCHASKTGRQAQAAQHKGSRERPAEPHPGVDNRGEGPPERGVPERRG